MHYVLLSCRFLIALTFAASVLGKIRGKVAYRGFVAATQRLAPTLPTRVTALAVIAAEILIIFLLVAQVTLSYGFIAAALLFVTFTFSLVKARLRGDEESCHCFGKSTEPIGVAHIARNIILIVVSCCGAVLSLLSQTSSISYEAGGVGAAFIAAFIGATVIVLSDDISFLLKN
ncbi:MauE/DoxX family redox-associated membrane protein [Streptosporangium sp. NPDC023615]|uniref:MauE/DoxX family redox-associated membrane protein n=1 Tax=Streptosporangium sp. NPDC023615 TaxID=3154794 RepID=UPI00343FEA90